MTKKQSDMVKSEKTDGRLDPPAHPLAKNADDPFRGSYMGPNIYSRYIDVQNRLRCVEEMNLEELNRALQVDDLQKTVKDAIERRIRKLEGE